MVHAVISIPDHAFREIEVLVVDNAGTDGMFEQVNAIDDALIRCLEPPENTETEAEPGYLLMEIVLLSAPAGQTGNSKAPPR